MNPSTDFRANRPAFCSPVLLGAGVLLPPLRGASVRGSASRVPIVAASRPRQSRAVVKMGYDPDPKRFAFGFTYYAEKLNGRAAMVGFMIALGYEFLMPEKGGLVPVLLSLLGKGGS